MSDFLYRSGTVDSIHGPTRNIWRSSVPYEVVFDKESKQQKVAHAGNCSYSQDAKVFPSKADSNKDWYIAGGSSGGSAVAVATGACFA